MAGFVLTLTQYFLPALSGGFTRSEGLVTWIDVGKVVIPFGTRMDQLALLMTLIVTGVGSAIFVYALGYMQGDPSHGRASSASSRSSSSRCSASCSRRNFFQTFIFWELVGVSSYLLIGYYWTEAQRRRRRPRRPSSPTAWATSASCSAS